MWTQKKTKDNAITTEKPQPLDKLWDYQVAMTAGNVRGGKDYSK
jgi:hypothetical protein